MGMGIGIGVVIALIVVATLAWWIWRARRMARAMVILDPRWAVLDLTRESRSEEIATDQRILAPILGTPTVSISTPPGADILFIYGRFDANGGFANGGAALRELIRDSGAKVVVLASDNDPSLLAAAAPNVGYGYANLIVTLERRGSALATFLGELFTRMYAGETMPLAWVTLSPQIPGREEEEDPHTPSVIFLPEAGQLTFAASTPAPQRRATAAARG